MATNEIFDDQILSVVVTDPATPVSGDPCRYGFATGVAVTDEGGGGNPATMTSVDFGMKVWSLPVTDSVGGGIAVGDTLFYNDAADDVRNNPAGYFFGVALAAVGVGATTAIRVLHLPSPGSGTIGAGTIATANLAAGLLSADAAGRAKMAADYFNAATVLTHFDANCFDTANLLLTLLADSITNAVLLQAVLNGAFQADAATRALFADGIWTEAKHEAGAAGAGLTGLVLKFLANANVIGAIPVAHEIDIADASANTDVVFTHKTRILDAWIQNTGAAAHATDDHVQLINQTGPVTLTEELAKTATQYAIKRFATIIDPVIAAGDTIRVTAVKVTNVACKLFILGARMA